MVARKDPGVGTNGVPVIFSSAKSDSDVTEGGRFVREA